MSVNDLAKIAAAVLMAAGLILRPLPLPAQTEIEIQPLTETNTRLYLSDGTVVMGRMIEHSKDLVILQVNEQVFTFELEEIDRIVTLDSLGAGARTVSVIEFPYISFLGGTVAFGLLSWLQFDTASDRERDADLNEASGVLARARELRDKADRARLLGWSSAASGRRQAPSSPWFRAGRSGGCSPNSRFGLPASGSPEVFLAYKRRF